LRKPVPVFIPAIVLSFFVLLTLAAFAQQPTFRNAPASESAAKNPYAGSASAAAAGKTLYSKNCAQCHGNNKQGMGPAPALDTQQVEAAKPGELLWFISTGKPASGMPAWPTLTKQQKWQVVTYLQTKSK
jgi:mono/diheme cytochrome c family protein